MIINSGSSSQGTTFTPEIDADGVISWTNDGGLPNPESVDLVEVALNRLPVAEGVGF